MPESSDRLLTLGDSVLLLGFRRGYEVLAPRLLGLGYRVVRAETLEDALGSLQLADPPVRALLLPPEPPLSDLGNSLRWLTERSAENLRAVVTGARGSRAQIDRLRAAGVTLALWEPFTDGELRFVVNHLLYNPRLGESRAQLRVPTRLVAPLRGCPGAKEASVHDLSTDGAYLETNRPAEAGSELEIELPLPAGLVRLWARVLSSVAPSPWQREPLPRGMGVRFLDLGASEREALERYVNERARSFQL